MTAQSRNPRDFWISPLKMKTALSSEPHFICWDKEIYPGNIHVREILPEPKDEVRVSREDWETIKKHLIYSVDYHRGELIERIEK